MNKVLLIEDDTVLRENTAELLELSEYHVLTATNGIKGVAAAKHHLPNIIICDIMMPEMDGYGVLNALAQDPSTKHIPFIFLSAKTERKDIRKGMESGADDYLTKPFEEKELIGAIKSRLARMSILTRMAESDKTTVFNTEKIQTIHELKNYIDDHGTEIKYAIGETIYWEGHNSNLIYLIRKGSVKTHKLDKFGKDLITTVYKPDDFFGFTSFTKNRPYQEFATAMEETQLISFPNDTLQKILENNNHLAMELMQMLTENLSEIKEQLLQMAYASVRRKTANTILKFAEQLEKDSQGRLHILRSDLASVAGMATETLIRTLSSFKKEGLIDIQDRNIRLLNLEGLKKVN